MRRELHDFVVIDADPDATGLITVSFTLTFDATSSVSTTDAGDEALSNYNVHITGIGDEASETAMFSLDGGGTFDPIVRIGDAVDFAPPMFPFEFQLDVSQFVSGPGGADSSAHSGVVTVLYTVDAVAIDGESAFSIFVRAGNSALAIITPEPSSLTLVMLALGIATLRRPSRRSKGQS